MSHKGADFLCQKEEVIDYVLGLSREFFSEEGILRRDAYRTGVQMTSAHHDASCSYQRRRRKRAFIRAKERSDYDVPASLELPVCLQSHAATQIVCYQDLLCLGQPKLPGKSSMLDRGERRGAGASIVTGDRDVIRLCLRDPGSDGTNAHLGHELDAGIGRRIYALEVVD